MIQFIDICPIKRKLPSSNKRVTDNVVHFCNSVSKLLDVEHLELLYLCKLFG